MKPLALILLAPSMLVPAAAQQVRPVRPVMRPPASANSTGPAAHSTAQNGAQNRVQNRVQTGVQAGAQNPGAPLTQLPDFTATDATGRLVAAGTLARPSHWLLFYTRDQCVPCDRVLSVLSQSQSPALKRGAPYSIVLAHPRTHDALDTERAKYPALTDALWLEEKDGSATTALAVKGAPMLYGMRGSQIAWVVPGGLDNINTVEKIAGAWLSSVDLPQKSTGLAASPVPATVSTLPVAAPPR